MFCFIRQTLDISLSLSLIYSQFHYQSNYSFHRCLNTQSPPHDYDLASLSSPSRRKHTCRSPFSLTFTTFRHYLHLHPRTSHSRHHYHSTPHLVLPLLHHHSSSLSGNHLSFTITTFHTPPPSFITLMSPSHFPSPSGAGTLSGHCSPSPPFTFTMYGRLEPITCFIFITSVHLSIYLVPITCSFSFYLSIYPSTCL